MTDFKKLFQKYWLFGLLAAIAMILVTIVSATSGDVRQSGSSYSNAATGYSAWYRMMVDRGIKIHRWQRPFLQLADHSKYGQGTTLLQVQPQLERFAITDLEQKWVSKGNTLIILGVTAPAQETAFRTDLDSSEGAVRIETTRRFTEIAKSKLPLEGLGTTILRDQKGVVIKAFQLDKGRVILATTPHLAANAYQDFRPNYELLAELVGKDRQEVLVDEYIHGYSNRKSKSAANGQRLPADDSESNNVDDKETGDAFGYLASTPWIVVLLNLILGTIVLLWQQNRRFGKVIIPKLPEVDNSEAYIQALSGVLYQANSSEFVLQNIGRSEQLSWQQKLGLGRTRLVESPLLIAAWENRLKLPADDLRFVLQLATEARRLTPAELTIWLNKVQTIDRQLTKI
jgi:Domain of unknown function (DUF4350)